MTNFLYPTSVSKLAIERGIDLLMNFAIDKDMDPNSFTQAQMEVDYVRVYQKE